MPRDFFNRIPINLSGGFFIYTATGEEELCFADKNVMRLFDCDTYDELCALTGNSFRGMVHPEDLDRVEGEIKEQTMNGEERHDYVQYRIITRRGEVRYVEDFGHLVYNDEGDSFFYVFIMDIERSECLKMNQNEWAARVGYRHEKRNALTGLVYEGEFYAACEQKLNDVTVNWLLMVIDLQNFKLFNEWYGREAGDMLLSEVGHELQDIADRHEGIAGYLGGDDFAIMMPSGIFDAEALLDRMQAVIARHGESIGFFPAIGASYSNGNTSAYRIYDQASLACHEAKLDPKTRIKFFSQAMVSRAEEDHKVLSAFREAMANGEITFFLQPQCRSYNGKVLGAEALARWIQPDGRMVPPAAFIPTLERYGFVPDLDRYIWEAVCRWSRKLLDEGKFPIPVSVNVSPVDIFALDVPAYFEELVERYQIPKSAIKIEITESAYSEGSDKVRATVQALRSEGFVVLMDDFGSGFSSLNMLRELNVDIIKLDAYFLRMDKNNERKGMHIIESVVNMAKTMALPVIVEGVETKSQRDYLMGLGIRYIQGYYFYKPMPVQDFETLISDPKKVDTHGFVFKANEEFKIREFLNDSVYSDSMLNNIIGPAAIYSLHEGDIDIIRFNQQFYQAVSVPDFHSRLLGIQNFMPEDEVPELFKTLKKSYEDRLNGAGGIFTFKKIDGSASRFLIHFYFLNEDEEQRRFYGAARDVTELTNLQRHIELLSRFTSRTLLFLLYKKGEYYFQVVAHGLADVMGLSSQELEEEFNSRGFCKRLQNGGDKKLWKLALRCSEEKRSMKKEFVMTNGNGAALNIIVDAEPIDDELGDVRCILSIRKK